MPYIRRKLPSEASTAPRSLRARQQWSEKAAATLRMRQRQKQQMFLTRTHGTPNQIGKKFPLFLDKKKLPVIKKLRMRGPTPSEAEKLKELEMDALKEAGELKAAFPKAKGWIFAVHLESGRKVELTTVADDWQQAMERVRWKMEELSKQGIDEIVIIDPSFSEIVGKIGRGAARFGRAMAKGIAKMPAKAVRTYKEAEKAALKVARGLGRVSALPAETREAYAAAKRERPWPVEGAAPSYEEEKEEAALAEARRLGRIGVSTGAYEPGEIEAQRIRSLTPTQRAVRREIMRIDHEPQPFMPAYETEKLRLLREETARTERAREAAIEARPAGPREAWGAPKRKRINGRSYRPYGVPLRSYQSAGQE